MDTENPIDHRDRSGLARVAVTGAAGFLGGWITRQLRAQEDRGDGSWNGLLGNGQPNSRATFPEFRADDHRACGRDPPR